MLPNRFPDDGSAPTEGDYDNADGTVSGEEKRKELIDHLFNMDHLQEQTNNATFFFFLFGSFGTLKLYVLITPQQEISNFSLTSILFYKVSSPIIAKAPVSGSNRTVTGCYRLEPKATH